MANPALNTVIKSHDCDISNIIEYLKCSICYDLFRTPVTAACGHTFCDGCLKQSLSSKGCKGCPLCKKYSNRRDLVQDAPRESISKFCQELAAAFTADVKDIEQANEDIVQSLRVYQIIAKGPTPKKKKERAICSADTVSAEEVESLVPRVNKTAHVIQYPGKNTEDLVSVSQQVNSPVFLRSSVDAKLNAISSCRTEEKVQKWFEKLNEEDLVNNSNNSMFEDKKASGPKDESPRVSLTDMRKSAMVRIDYVKGETIKNNDVENVGGIESDPYEFLPSQTKPATKRKGGRKCTSVGSREKKRKLKDQADLEENDFPKVLGESPMRVSKESTFSKETPERNITASQKFENLLKEAKANKQCRDLRPFNQLNVFEKKLKTLYSPTTNEQELLDDSQQTDCSDGRDHFKKTPMTRKRSARTPVARVALFESPVKEEAGTGRKSRRRRRTKPRVSVIDNVRELEETTKEIEDFQLNIEYDGEGVVPREEQSPNLGKDNLGVEDKGSGRSGSKERSTTETSVVSNVGETAKEIEAAVLEEKQTPNLSNDDGADVDETGRQSRRKGRSKPQPKVITKLKELQVTIKKVEKVGQNIENDDERAVPEKPPNLGATLLKGNVHDGTEEKELEQMIEEDLSDKMERGKSENTSVISRSPGWSRVSNMKNDFQKTGKHAKRTSTRKALNISGGEATTPGPKINKDSVPIVSEEEMKATEVYIEDLSQVSLLRGFSQISNKGDTSFQRVVANLEAELSDCEKSEDEEKEVVKKELENPEESRRIEERLVVEKEQGEELRGSGRQEDTEKLIAEKEVEKVEVMEVISPSEREKNIVSENLLDCEKGISSSASVICNTAQERVDEILVKRRESADQSKEQVEIANKKRNKVKCGRGRAVPFTLTGCIRKRKRHSLMFLDVSLLTMVLKKSGSNIIKLKVPRGFGSIVKRRESVSKTARGTQTSQPNVDQCTVHVQTSPVTKWTASAAQQTTFVERESRAIQTSQIVLKKESVSVQTSQPPRNVTSQVAATDMQQRKGVTELVDMRLEDFEVPFSNYKPDVTVNDEADDWEEFDDLDKVSGLSLSKAEEQKKREYRDQDLIDSQVQCEFDKSWNKSFQKRKLVINSPVENTSENVDRMNGSQGDCFKQNLISQYFKSDEDDKITTRKFKRIRAMSPDVSQDLLQLSPEKYEEQQKVPLNIPKQQQLSVSSSQDVELVVTIPSQESLPCSEGLNSQQLLQKVWRNIEMDLPNKNEKDSKEGSKVQEDLRDGGKQTSQLLLLENQKSGNSLKTSNSEESDSDLFVDQTPPKNNVVASEKAVQELDKNSVPPNSEDIIANSATGNDQSFLRVEQSQSGQQFATQETPASAKKETPPVFLNKSDFFNVEGTQEKIRQRENAIKTVQANAIFEEWVRPSQKAKYCITSSGVINSPQIEAFVNRFNLEYSSKAVKKMTHLVVGLHKNDDDVESPLCTSKVLFALAHGKWIVAEGWVAACLEANVLLPEEKFESVDPLGGDGCLRARLAKEPLLKDMEVYLLGEFAMISRNELSEIVQACGGHLVNHPEQFSTEPNRLRVMVADRDKPTLDEHILQEMFRRYNVAIVSRDFIFNSLQAYSLCNLNPHLLVLASEGELLRLGYPYHLVHNEDDSEWSIYK